MSYVDKAGKELQHLASPERAAKLHGREFVKTGAIASRQSWLAGSEPYHNLITSYNNEKTKRLVAGTHFDFCGSQPGADDNARANLLAAIKPVKTGHSPQQSVFVFRSFRLSLAYLYLYYIMYEILFYSLIVLPYENSPQ